MKNEQKALIVMTGSDKTRGLDELNIHLNRGWRVAHLSPMGGAATGSQDGDPVMCLAALVILERVNESTATILEQVQEEAEELLDDFTEGDGSSAGLPGNLGDTDLQ